MEPNQANEMSALTTGFTVSAIVASIFSTLLTWIKETNPPVMAYMKSLTGHHWITHGLAVVIVFLVLGFLFSNMTGVQKMRGMILTYMLVISVVLSGLGIFGFFLLAFY